MNKFTRLLLCAMVASNLISPTPATAAAPLDQTTLTVCTSLKTGNKLISKTGKCNERIYEARTWFQKGSAPSGTPESKPIDLVTCTSRTSTLQIIRTRSACNSKTQTTALWQRPLGAAVAPSITSVVMGLLGTSTLNIAAPMEDGGARITSYLVTSSPAAVAATYTPAQIKAAKITGLTPGSTYSFSVVAINSKGSSPSSIASAPALAPTIPNVPGITKVVATGTSSAQLTFTAPLDNGGSSVTSYVATSLPGGLQTTVYQSVGGTINITNLSHSTTYTFTLTAINAAGSSLTSAISTSVTTATPPPPPEPVAAAPSAPTDTVISVAAIAGVTAPVTGVTPVSTTTAGTGYTGTVSWSGTPTTFAGVTTYTATITLTPASGYTLTGVTANFFTVAGATTDTNPANSGVITAVFPATEVGAAREVANTRVSVGTQRRTAFTTQPQITVQDAGGNTVTSSSAVVTATVSTGGTLVGSTTATASSGVATFTGLGVNGTIGTTYTITYEVTGLVVATATVTLTATTCNGSFTCQIGDTGPGGGKIFYVASTLFTQVSATGSMCTTNCKYLEAAPTSGTNAWTDNSYVWSDSTAATTGTKGTAIGTGFNNTVAMVTQSATAIRAGSITRAYRGPNNLDDWYLSSKDELNQLCRWARGNNPSNDRCSGGSINSGPGAAGFKEVSDSGGPYYYWSSSEDSAGNDATWAQVFSRSFFDTTELGSQGIALKSQSAYVRPVRAFGPAPIVISVAAIAGVTAPVTGATPVTTTTAGTGYTGTVSWSGTPTTFSGATIYTATITLTSAAGYTLTGVTENFFTVAGATSVTHSANSGVISAVFPATAASTKAITAFTVPGQSGLSTITSTGDTTGTIATTVLYATNVTALVATFSHTGSSIAVASVAQVSATTANDFTSPVSYLVTAADGSTKTWSVTITVAAPIVISVAAIAGVTAPVTGTSRVSTTTAGTGYTGTVTWSGSPATFASATIYTATITLTPAAGYTLTGVAADFFTVAGATTDTNPENSGVITAVFPATATTISVAAIAGVTAPVTGATPVTTTTAGTGYTGTVSWSGALTGGKFVAATTYTVTITLTPTSGYTLSGVAANFFTIAGAKDVTHSANSGVITAIFYMVGSIGPGGGKIYYFYAPGFNCGATYSSTGSPSGGLCHYLEVTKRSSNTYGDVRSKWGSDGNVPTIADKNSLPADNTVSGLGLGYKNSLAIANFSGIESAADLALAHRGGGKSDWYLPTSAELNELRKWASGSRAQPSLGTMAASGSVNDQNNIPDNGFTSEFIFTTGYYWSSSEWSAELAWYQRFQSDGNGTQQYDDDKRQLNNLVRPVRSF